MIVKEIQDRGMGWKGGYFFNKTRTVFASSFLSIALLTVDWFLIKLKIWFKGPALLSGSMMTQSESESSRGVLGATTRDQGATTRGIIVTPPAAIRNYREPLPQCECRFRDMALSQHGSVVADLS